ncbi:hypothetical protein [Bosea caraganae]|nr:hypothetical protein [Bosea caraganae]
MIAMLAVVTFMAGFMVGDAFGSLRWRRAAEEALALAAVTLARKREGKKA